MLGQTISHYRIIEKLGGGGMGVVYRAEDERLKRSVAIKVLPPELTRDREAKARFVLEAQAASALDHPNICTIYEIDETPDGQMFLALAYYPGETLKRKIERGPMKLDDALDYGIQIAQALKKAHEHGIVHRDIKPANVLVTGDALIKVLDFGLAKLVSQSGLTRTGTVLGTVSYMSPEQGLGQIADARSDLWSLGVVLHEMIAGQLPFRGDSEMAVASAIAHSAAPPLTSLRAGLPLELDRVVGRTLAKSPDDRYQTAADLLSELRRLRRESGGHSSTGQLTGPGVSGAAGQTTQPLPVWRRSPTGLLVATLAVVAVGIGYWVLAGGDPAASLTELAHPIQVAATVGVEGSPSWSPDGSMIAYDSTEGVFTDIWVTQLGGGPPINRTADNPAPDRFPRWSPDRLQIAFYSLRADGPGIFLMPALAGAARKVAPSLSLSAAPPVWSPDSAELGYAIDEKDVVYLELLHLEGHHAACCARGPERKRAA
jgi:tRNA A-37 threonylcarbamoyl transferase component Bud32